ncbi:putative 3-phosphoinositide-dependent protein kinase 2 [Macrotis lagotis]|uniref:putative 3-phosphoinositide-dependent protein kinase 2 n=1 Tax=Macrotis lagotis TaxID=92651 RepID=UPI003D694373
MGMSFQLSTRTGRRRVPAGHATPPQVALSESSLSSRWAAPRLRSSQASDAVPVNILAMQVFQSRHHLCRVKPGAGIVQRPHGTMKGYPGFHGTANAPEPGPSTPREDLLSGKGGSKKPEDFPFVKVLATGEFAPVVLSPEGHPRVEELEAGAAKLLEGKDFEGDIRAGLAVRKNSPSQSCFRATVPIATSNPTMRADPRPSPSEAPPDPAPAVKAGLSPPWHDLYPTQRWSKKPKDFALGKVLGEGAFGTVVLGRELATSRDFAIKILKKKKIKEKNQVCYVYRELDILARLDHPFCVRLYCSFQDKKKLYFVLSYAQNGDLESFLQKVGPLDEACARFYSAEMVSALEYLHGLDIMHRDLKPENILLDGDMHIQIADFGLAKRLLPLGSQVSAHSFVGTTHYMCPELLLGKNACKSLDLWALGCVIYYLVAGLHPFLTHHDSLTFSKILSLAYDFPEEFFPKAKDLVGKLLVIDPTNRLGCEEMGSYGALKEHPFFANIPWDKLHLQTPPRVPGFLVFLSKGKNGLRNVAIGQSLNPPSSSGFSTKGEPSSHQRSPGRVVKFMKWVKSLWN